MSISVEFDFDFTGEAPIDGQIWMQFPDGFNISGATLDSVSGFDGSSLITIADKLIKLVRLGDGTPFASGAYNVTLGGIYPASGSYSIAVSVTEFSGDIVVGPSNATIVISNDPVDDGSTVDVSPASVVADGMTASTITVFVADIDGNPVSGAPVEVFATGTGNTITPTSGISNGSGIFQAALTSTVDEAKVVTASVGLP